MKTLLRRKEAAKLLKASERTLERWASNGQGPPFSMAVGIALYDLDELLEWLQRNRRGEPARASA